jgi:hypothetical protein
MKRFADTIRGIDENDDESHVKEKYRKNIQRLIKR